jgi:SAM-dependent methyltransferase
MDPRLPFDSNSYDLVLCSLSVEYLTSPWDVFSDLARVVKPGGHVVVTFSNRWFEPKAIRIWNELHEFERMGLVLEYFKESRTFDDLRTYSVRGLPRPADDKYSGQIPFSDPVYAVWGRRE